MRAIICFILITVLISCNGGREHQRRSVSVIDYFDIDTSWHYINNGFHACLEDSIDSYLEIRFTTSSCFFTPNQFLYLKYDGVNWKAFIGLHPRILDHKSFKKEVTPKIGWKNFEDSLISIDINSFIFRDAEKDAINDRILHGELLQLEIITTTQYKIYSYLEPKFLIKENKKSESLRKFGRLFNLVNSNFDDYYNKPVSFSTYK